MANLRCNTCRGTYSDVSSQGEAYFHACSPLVIQELKPLVGNNIFFCPGIGAPSATLTLPGVGATTVVSTGFLESMIPVREFIIERTNRRDENIVINSRGEQTGIKAAGNGVTRL